MVTNCAESNASHPILVWHGASPEPLNVLAVTWSGGRGSVSDGATTERIIASVTPLPHHRLGAAGGVQHGAQRRQGVAVGGSGGG